MGDWLGLIIALAVGLPLLAVAVWFDARRRRRLEGDRDAPPERGEASVDAHAPTYVTQSEIDALPLPGAARKPEAEHRGTRLGFGHAVADFATNGDQAELTAPRILMVDGDVTSARELLALLSSATEASPLVVVATGIDADVLATLAANRRALGTNVLAATAGQKDLYELGAIVGGEVLTVADLKAGYTPASSMGSASSWTSNLKSTWIEPRQP